MVVIRAKDNFGNVADLDVLQEAELRVDVSAVESGDLGEVFGISSQEFMLPGTDNNNAFFGNIFNLGAEPSIALNHTVFASVMVDGNEIFSGKMYINNVLTDQKGYTMYKALVINETVDFKTRIENLFINELDFSDSYHDLTLPNITSSWDGNLAGGNIVYPLADYGTPEGANISLENGAVGANTFNNDVGAISLQDFKPGIKLKYIIDKVFDTVDYNYSSSFFDSAYFDKLFVLSTPSSERGIAGQDPVQYAYLATFSGSTQVIPDGAVNTTVIFPTEDYDNGFDYNNVTGEYTVPATGDYVFDTNLQVSWSSAPASGEYRRIIARIKINGSTVATVTDYSTNANATVTLQQIVNNVQVGDVVTVTVSNQTLDNINGNVIAGVPFTIKNRNSIFEGQSLGSLYSGTVDVGQMFGTNEKVLDLLKGVFQKFNLVMEPKIGERNTLIIEPYNTWVEGGSIKDWTDKVDRDTRFSIKGTMVDNEKFINFKDLEDDDILNDYTQRVYKKTFGEFLYFDQGDLTQGTKEIGTFFAPTPVMAVDGGSTTVIPHLYKKENSTKTPIAWKPRLLHFNGKRTVDDINAYSGGALVGKGYYINDGTGANLITEYGSFHYLEIDPTENAADFDLSRDLNWNNSQQVHFASPSFKKGYYVKRDAIWEYWAYYINSLYDPESKMLTCNVYFTPDELKDLQLNDKIFIDGQYYRINNIKSFDLTQDCNVEVELIKRPVRQFQFPRRRVYDDTTSGGNGGTYTDVTLDPGSLGADGSGVYVTVDDDLPVTGSGNQELVGRVAPLDGFTLYPDTFNPSGSVTWLSPVQESTAGFREQIVLGNNKVDFTSNNTTTVGSNNTIEANTNIVNVQGVGNNVGEFSQYVNVTGDNNIIETNTQKSSILNSSTSEISGNTVLSTIIGGDDTIISASNQSVAIGQNITVEGGNSNIVIGNYDTQTRTTKDLINTVVINPNRDLESWENLGGDDFDGRAYFGSNHTIGAIYRDNTPIEVYNGANVYLTGSEYANDYFYLLSWNTISGSGTANIYLPDTNPSNLVGRESNGYKRELRFMSDDSFNAGGAHKADIYGLGTDTIDSTTSPSSYRIDKAYDGVTFYAPVSGSWFITQKKA